MGLERTAAVLQGVISNYDTDLFVPLLKRAAELCGVEFQREEHLEEGKGGAASLRVIADHARATTFLITDGVIPSNEGRGYVLRKIIRRAIRHGHLLGMDRPFLSQMVDAVSDLMKEAYPDLGESQIRVSQTVLSEEKQFARTIQLASEKLDELIGSTKSEERKRCIDSFIRDSGNDWDRRGVEQVVDAFLPERALDPRRVSGDVVVLSDSDLKIRRYFKSTFIRGCLALRRSASTKHMVYRRISSLMLVVMPESTLIGRDSSGDGGAADEGLALRGRAAGKEAASPAYAKIAETFKTEKDFYSRDHSEGRQD